MKIPLFFLVLLFVSLCFADYEDQVSLYNPGFGLRFNGVNQFLDFPPLTFGGLITIEFYARIVSSFFFPITKIWLISDSEYFFFLFLECEWRWRSHFRFYRFQLRPRSESDFHTIQLFSDELLFRKLQYCFFARPIFSIGDMVLFYHRPHNHQQWQSYNQFIHALGFWSFDSDWVWQFGEFDECVATFLLGWSHQSQSDVLQWRHRYSPNLEPRCSHLGITARPIGPQF